ncbi:MAG: GNAT family N-acetyltransferase [Verrucomicrobiia bacterium]
MSATPSKAEPRARKRAMTVRRATLNDCALLADLNHQLIRDEGHRNRMTIPELEQRMKSWLASEYTAVLFEIDGAVVACAVFAEQPEKIYLRQLFVVRDRRRQGIGRQAMEIMRAKIWPANKRLTVEVLVRNAAATAFWRAVGYRDYSLMLEIMPPAH